MSDEHDATASGSAPLSLVRYEEMAATTPVQVQRAGKAKQITRVVVRPNLAARADLGGELRAVRAAVAQMTYGEFVCWLALNEGVFLEPLTITARRRLIATLTANTRLRYVRRWWLVSPPATVASVPETAAQYGYTERTVRQYDQMARALVVRMRAAYGLPTAPPDPVRIWPFLAPDGGER